MPWWSWVWVVLMLAVTVAGIASDWRSREPLWFTFLGLASGVACIFFVFNYFGSTRLGRLVLPALVTLVALVYEAWRDVNSDPELTSGGKIVTFIVTVGLYAPAAVLGMIGSPA